MAYEVEWHINDGMQVVHLIQAASISITVPDVEVTKLGDAPDWPGRELYPTIVLGFSEDHPKPDWISSGKGTGVLVLKTQQPCIEAMMELAESDADSLQFVAVDHGARSYLFPDEGSVGAGSDDDDQDDEDTARRSQVSQHLEILPEPERITECKFENNRLIHIDPEGLQLIRDQQRELERLRNLLGRYALHCETAEGSDLLYKSEYDDTGLTAPEVAEIRKLKYKVTSPADDAPAET